MSVEKYRVTKEDWGFTTFPNDLLQGLKDKHALGVYVYLSSLPDDWEFHKSHIQHECSIGEKKLRTILNILVQCALIEVAQERAQDGAFAHWRLHVRNPKYFINQSAQPLGQKRRAVNRPAVKQSYKENINKTNIETKEISKNLCAPESGARSRFDDFWFLYPRKKDKARAQQVWIRKKLDSIADKIIDKVSQQMRFDSQWQTAQFIPHPATYLRNERWEDEIEQINANNPKKMSVGQQAVADAFREMREGKLQ